MSRPNTRLTDWEASQIRDKCGDLLTRRRALAYKPWGSSPYKFYFNLLPTDLKAAITLINEKMEGNFKRVLNFETAGTVALRDTDKGIILRWTGEKPCMYAGWSSADHLTLSERHPRYADLYNFCDYADMIDEENGKVGNLVKHVTAACNTFGQIHRVWPDLLPTIGGSKVAAAEGQLRKSQLPAALDTDYVFRERDDATAKLAQASLLGNLANHFSWTS